MPFSAVWSGSTLLVILSKQYYQSLHCFTFSAVWSRSTLFAILSSLIRVYTICYSQYFDQSLHYLPFWAVLSDSTLFTIISLIRVYTIFPFSAVWSRSTLSFSTVWSGSTLFAILSSRIKVKVHCHSQEQSEQCPHYLQFSASNQDLHCLPFSAVWLGSTLFAISQQSDQSLHYYHSHSDPGLHY